LAPTPSANPHRARRGAGALFLPPQIELDWLKPPSITYIQMASKSMGGLSRKEEIIPTLGWCSPNVQKKKGEKKSLWSGVIHYSVLQMDPSFFYTSTLNLILSIFSLMREGERQTLLKTERITFASSRKQERENPSIPPSSGNR
jgi:hypothetical protein